MESLRKNADIIVILMMVFVLGLVSLNKLTNIFGNEHSEVVKNFPIENVSRVCIVGVVDECFELNGKPAKISFIKDNKNNGRNGYILQIEAGK